MKWIIEHIHQDNGTSELIQELRSLNRDVSVISYEPFLEVDLSTVTDGFLIGSINLCESVQKQRLSIRMFASFDRYKCSQYLPIIGNLCLNDSHDLFTSLDDLFDSRHDIFLKYSEDSCIFVRPDSGTKSFSGSVVDARNLEHQVKVWNSYGQSGPVVVSRPVKIKAEWRLYVSVSERRIIASSLYRLDGNFTLVEGCPKEAKELALNVCVLYQPDLIFVVDVASTTDGFKVVEINAASSCGPYATNKKDLIEGIERIF